MLGKIIALTLSATSALAAVDGDRWKAFGCTWTAGWGYAASAPEGEFHDMIGAYTAESGPGVVEVTWSNIGFWTD